MHMHLERPFIFIPVEIAKRELHAKLYFAMAAVDRGYTVLFGDPKKIKSYLSHFSPGVFIAKDLYKVRTGEFQRLKDHGDCIVAWDEEGLVFTAKQSYPLRMCDDTVKMADIIVTWGDYQKNIIEKSFPAHNTILSAGNPRMDLLRSANRRFFSREAKAIKRKYGDFILINSSFSHCNSYFTKSQLQERMNKFFSVRDPAKKKDFELQYSLEKERYGSFLELIRYLNKTHPEVRIVVRPHPVEDPGIWEHDLRDLSNVTICNEGNIIPWCMASRTVIHNSCTTGIEAFLLDKDVIVFDSVGKDYWDFNLPNSLGRLCKNVEEVESAVFSTSGSFRITRNGPHILKEHLASYQSQEATEFILDAIDGLAAPKLGRARISNKAKLFLLRIPRLAGIRIPILSSIHKRPDKEGRPQEARVDQAELYQEADQENGFCECKNGSHTIQSLLLQKSPRRLNPKEH